MLGTILVGLGGLLATYGWNQIRVQDQWRGTGPILGKGQHAALASDATGTSWSRVRACLRLLDLLVYVYL
jgi:hypothetical protein